MTDPIADMLTRIRNAITAKKESVEIPASNEKKAIAEILFNEGWIKDTKIVEEQLARLPFPMDRIDNIDGRVPNFRFAEYKKHL